MSARTRLVTGVAALALGALAACGSHETGGTGTAAPTQSQPAQSQPARTGPTQSRPVRPGPSASPTREVPTTPSVRPSHSQPPSSDAGTPVVVKVPGVSGTVALVVGQRLRVQISDAVSVVPAAQPCRPRPAGDALRRVCDSGDFTYQAVHAGTSQMVFTIRPRCTGGAMCPDWVRQARFDVHVVAA